MQHDWTDSTLGHGNKMCRRCFVTDLEADAIGLVDCDVPPPAPKAANENIQNYDDEDHGYEQPMICPVTSAPCTTEQDEFCEDYGCARKAGIDMDRDLIL